MDDKELWTDALFNASLRLSRNLYEEKVNLYLKDDSKYGLAYIPKSFEKLKIEEWYEFLGNDLTVVYREGKLSLKQKDEQELMNIDRGRKIIKRLRKDLLEWGMDIKNFNKMEEQEKWDNVKLLTFLYRFSRDYGIKFKPWLSSLSMENLEYLPDNELSPYNNELSTVMFQVLSRMANPEFEMINSMICFKIVMGSNGIEEKLLLYMEQNRPDIQCLIKIRNVVNEAEKDTEERKGKEIKYDSVFDKMVLRMEAYYLQLLAKSQIEIYDYVNKIDITVEDNNSWFRIIDADRVDKTDIIHYAMAHKEEFCKLSGFSKKKYENIVKTTLTHYPDVMDEESELTGLHVYVMIEEIGSHLNEPLGKELGAFYRYKIGDVHRTLRTGLQDEKTQIMMKSILVERVNTIRYHYLHKQEEYRIITDVMRQIYNIQVNGAVQARSLYDMEELLYTINDINDRITTILELYA